MTQNADIVGYLNSVDEKRRPHVEKLFKTIQDNLPPGFGLGFNYGMIGWVVPLDRYPDGYHVTPGAPLPFLNLAAQKRHVALYHMGIYASPELLAWFEAEYPKHCKTKLNMGKSCIRFTNASKIPFDLIGELVSRMSVDDWIELYEASTKR